jgi:hypothetical protein
MDFGRTAPTVHHRSPTRDAHATLASENENGDAVQLIEATPVGLLAGPVAFEAAPEADPLAFVADAGL